MTHRCLKPSVLSACEEQSLNHRATVLTCFLQFYLRSVSPRLTAFPHISLGLLTRFHTVWLMLRGRLRGEGVAKGLGATARKTGVLRKLSFLMSL